MKPGDVVLVNWRDALPRSGEPNKVRPGIVVSADILLETVPFAIVVPLAGSSNYELDGVTLEIEPTSENGCNKRSYALSWSVHTVPHARITVTHSRITEDQLREIRSQIAICVGAG